MRDKIDFTKIYDGDQPIAVLNFNNMIPVENASLHLLISVSTTMILRKSEIIKNYAKRKLIGAEPIIMISLTKQMFCIPVICLTHRFIVKTDA